ncbi:hypothetical protein [Thioflexithrix psekupsensis]|uniref:Uncharacterized protein n=1 Tax=Thioflexithrix psekupsensis TaxID=1570016 RepID=A0A251X5R1_9GAMM|nr:hypothetical protein [Thioflexithrix psekupsensis]OUD12539.1 hypothetical protein TPSD3_15745 [Thioflexithrix psekupsensis]
MSDFMLQQCFTRFCPVLQSDGFVATRLQQLAAQLQEHHTAILQFTYQQLTDVNPSLINRYHEWFKSWIIHDHAQSHRQSFSELHQELGYHHFLALIESYNQSLAHFLDESFLIWCDQHSHDLQLRLTAHWQQQQLRVNIDAIVEQVIAELRSLPSLQPEWDDQPSTQTSGIVWADEEDDAAQVKPSASANSPAPEMVKLNAAQLKQQLKTVLTQWCELPLNSQVELENLFLRDFACHLIAPLSASQRFWKALLVKLDRHLSHALHGSLRTYILTNALEVLIAAVPRYPFIASVVNTLLPLYEELNAPIGELLLLNIMRNSLPDGDLAIRYMQQLDLQAIVAQLDEQLALLPAGNQEAIQLLRPYWERAELDWLAEAIEQLERQLQHTQLTPLFLLSNNEWRKRFSSLLTEGLTNQRGTETTCQLLEEVMAQAIRAHALSPRPQLARDLFRRAVTLCCTPDKQWIVWKKHRQMALALQNLEADHFDDSAVWIIAKPILISARPIFAAFDHIVADNIEFSLHWYKALNLPTSFNRQSSLGCRLNELQQNLYYLALYLRLYNPYSAILHLKRRYAEHLTQHSYQQGLLSLDSRAILDAFRELQAHVQATSGISADLLQGLQQFVSLLPTMTASLQLYRQTSVFTLFANIFFLKTYPNYIQCVGERGIQLGIRDNELTLQRVAQVLISVANNPSEHLQLWFNCFASDMANIEKRTLEANLAALNHVLQTHLLADEAEPVYALINDVYVKSLGITYNPATAGQQQQLQFFELILTGSRWQQLFNKNAKVPRYLSVFLEQLPLLLKETQLNAELANFLQEQLQLFTQALIQHGEEESAWQYVLPAFDCALQRHRTRELEMAWRSLLAVLPANCRLFWQPALLRGIRCLRQVGLGRAISRHSRLLAQQMTQQLLIISPPSPEKYAAFEIKGYRDLGKFLDHTAHVLRNQCPTLAALNLGRYLVECIVPFVDYPGRFWQMAWLQLTDTLLLELDDCEQLALIDWTRQLAAISHSLPDTKALGQFVFHNIDFLFAETRQMEQHWRDFIGGLLVATMTEDNAPISGSVLAQRLLLSSPIFQNETAASWEERASTLIEALNEYLTEPLIQRLNQRQMVLTRNLIACEKLSELRKGGQGIGAGALLLSASPDSRTVWYSDLAMRVAYEQQDSLSPTDALVLQLSQWNTPDFKQIRQQANLIQTVSDIPLSSEETPANSRWLTWLRGKSGVSYRLTLSQQHAFTLLLQQLVLEPILTQENTPNLLFEVLLLTFSHQDFPVLMRFNERVQRALNEQFPDSHFLPKRWQLLNAELPRFTLAQRLWLWHDQWAQYLVKQLKPFEQLDDMDLRRLQWQRTQRDLGFLLRRLSLQLIINDPPESFAQWFWEHIGSFLQPTTRAEALRIFPHCTEKLQLYLNPLEQKILESYMRALTDLSADPHWQMPAQRAIHHSITEAA